MHNNEITPRLTNREFEILSLMNNGYSIDECADYLEISRRTIDSHMANAYDHLQLFDKDRHINKALFLFRSLGKKLIEPLANPRYNKHIRILSLLDEGRRNIDIADACECSQMLVITIKKRYRPELMKYGRITKSNT